MAPHSLQQDVPLISAWPCNTALPNGTLAIRRTFSYLQRASFGSTSPWKRWRQALQQSLCPWTSFYHRWSSSTQWHPATPTWSSTNSGGLQRLWRGLVYFLGKGAEKARSERDQTLTKMNEIPFAVNSYIFACTIKCVCVCVCVFGQVVWLEFVRTSQQLNAPFCNQFLHLCMYHQVCMCVCVCVFGLVVWLECVRTSQQLNAAFCKQFLHLCMYHHVCVCVCVCVSSARLCDLSLSELVSN